MSCGKNTADFIRSNLMEFVRHPTKKEKDIGYGKIVECKCPKCGSIKRVDLYNADGYYVDKTDIDGFHLIICGECGNTFSVEGNMKQESYVYIKCPECGNSFVKEDDGTGFKKYKVANSDCDYVIKCPHCSKLFDPTENIVDSVNFPAKFHTKEFIFDDNKFDEIMQEDLQIKVNKVVDWIDKQIQDRKFEKTNGRIEIADTDELAKEDGLLEENVLYEVRRVFALRNLVFQFIEHDFKMGYKFIFQKALKEDEE